MMLCPHSSHRRGSEPLLRIDNHHKCPRHGNPWEQLRELTGCTWRWAIDVLCALERECSDEGDGSRIYRVAETLRGLDARNQKLLEKFGEFEDEILRLRRQLAGTTTAAHAALDTIDIIEGKRKPAPLDTTGELPAWAPLPEDSNDETSRIPATTRRSAAARKPAAVPRRARSLRP